MSVSAQSILTRVQEKVQDDEWASLSRVLDLLNRGIMECADRLFLPDLFVMDTITVANNSWATAADATPAPLPGNWNKGLFSLRNTSTGLAVKTWQNPVIFEENFPAPVFGHISDVCLIGKAVAFASVPAQGAAERLRFYYFRNPATITTTADLIEGIPDYLAVGVLMNFICANLYEGVEEGKDMPNRNFHFSEWQRYSTMLTDWCRLRAPQTIRNDRMRA